MQPNAAAAVGLDDAAAAVGQDVEADRLAQVRRSRHEVHLVVGEHGGAAVAVDGVGDAGRPAQGSVQVLAEVGVVARRRRAERGVEGAAALVVLAPGDRVVGAHRAAGDRVQHPVVGLLRERLLDDRGEDVADAADVGREVVPLLRAIPVLVVVLAGVVHAVGDLDRAALRRGLARRAGAEDVGQELPLGLGLDRRVHAHEAAAGAEPRLERCFLVRAERAAVRVEEENGVVPHEPMLVELAGAVGDDDVEVLLARELADLPHAGVDVGRLRPVVPRVHEDDELGRSGLRARRENKGHAGDDQCHQPTKLSHLSIPLPLNGISRGRPSPSCQEVLPVKRPSTHRAGDPVTPMIPHAASSLAILTSRSVFPPVKSAHVRGLRGRALDCLQRQRRHRRRSHCARHYAIFCWIAREVSRLENYVFTVIVRSAIRPDRRTASVPFRPRRSAWRERCPARLRRA